MTKPIVFNVVKAQERIAELEKENAHLRGEIKGAKILIWQQKNLVRCRDCKYSFLDDDTEYYECRHNKGMVEELYGTDFCSYGERKE